MRPTELQSRIVSVIGVSLTIAPLLACNLTKMLSKPKMFEGSATEEAAAALKKKIGGPNQ